VASRRSLYLRVRVCRLHLGPPAVVVLESAHSLGDGCGFLCLALETAESLGMSLRAFLGAVAAWRWYLASCAASLIVLSWFETTASAHQIYRWCGYACWCILQQLLFQNMAYRRLRDGMGASWKTSTIAGAMFAAAHVPNPILVPATFLWGTVSTRLFESRPSVPVLGVTQAILSGMLYVLTPVALNGQFRVGPGYWAVLHPSQLSAIFF